MKKITLFIVLSILIFCFIGQSAAMAIPFNQELDYVQVALSSLDKSPTCELLSTSVIESEGDFTCVEIVFLEKVPIATMNLNGGNTSRIDICHTWFRKGAKICSLELVLSFKWTGTSAVASTQNMNPGFEQYEIGSAYALGNLTTRSSNSASEKASITQIYTVCDKYSNICTGSFRAYCTIDGVCTGNKNESNNF